MMVALHRSPTNTELLLNLQEIAAAFPDNYASRGKVTVIRMRDGSTYNVTETFDEVRKRICSAWTGKGARE